MPTRSNRKTPAPARKITLADIAKRSEVSLTTVSLVLRNKPGVGIPAETRQRIMDTAQNLAYRVKTPPRAAGPDDDSALSSKLAADHGSGHRRLSD